QTLTTGRMPETNSRAWTSSGDGPIDTPWMTLARYRGHRSRSRTSTEATDSAFSSASSISMTGGRRFVPGAATPPAGHADHRHEIGAVGRHRDVENRVVQAEVLLEVPPDRGVGREEEDAA